MSTLETVNSYNDTIEILKMKKHMLIENYITQFYKKIDSISMQFNDFVLYTEEHSYAVYLKDSTEEHTFFFNVAEKFVDHESEEYESITITHIHDSEVTSKEEQKFTFSFDLQTDVLQFQKIVFNYMTNLMIEQLIWKRKYTLKEQNER